MKLYLARSREHALIAFAIREASKLAAKSKGYVGRTALQKIMYFVKRMGVPLPYTFDLYHYGPFCQDIYTAVEYLTVDEVIKDDSPDQSRYSNYVGGPNMPKLIRMYKDDVKRWSKKIFPVVKALVPYNPDNLELVATLDYLFQQEHAKAPETSDAQVRETVVSRFMSIKGAKFLRAKVEKTYDVLKKCGLLAA